MSIALMSLAFRTSLTCTQKMVLLALSDSANDQGECYPSVQNLIQKCSLSERAVQKSIVELGELGHLHRELRKGRSTIYWIHPLVETPAPRAPQSRTRCTPAPGAPPHQVHPTPAPGAPPPPHQVHPTPAPGAPITINEPSVEPSGNQRQKREPAPKVEVPIDVLVDAGFDQATAIDFLAHKRTLKSPLTERAWKDHVREAEAAGWTVLAAAEKVMAKNWRGFEAKYVANERRPQGAAAPRQQTTAERNAAAKKLLGFSTPTQETFDA